MAPKAKSREQGPARSTHLPAGVPSDLRGRIEAARLGLCALLRALDQLELAQSLPEELERLFELDADLAQALWALDQAPGRLDFAAMTRDTLASLEEIPGARQEFLDTLSKREQRGLCEQAAAVRATLMPETAYSQVPGRDSLGV